MAATCAMRGAFSPACTPARRIGGSAVTAARSAPSLRSLPPSVLSTQPLRTRQVACPRSSRSLVLSTRAAAAATGSGAAKGAADAQEQGGIGSLVKKLGVSVAKVLISLLPGRLGLTWLAGLLPSKVKNVFLSLFDCYVKEMVKAVGEKSKAEAVTMLVFKDMCKTYAEQMLIPYKFPSYHQSLRAPTDYYKMGQQYIGCLIDFDRSILMYPDRWTKIQQQLEAGENVILLANHQSEGDAAFIPLMTEITHPGLGEKVIYVAGDRVVSDKLAKPFSMGRNLLCVHSKKHIMDDPSTRSEKMRQNVKTLKEMERLLKQGGAFIWIAPSGGRDRWAEDGSLPPAPFDSAAVEMMVKLGTKKGTKPTHFVPMAMSTAEIMPPPRATEKELGEARVVHFTGAGLSLAEEVDVSPEGPWAEGVDTSDKGAVGEALTKYIYDRVCEVYQPIVACNDPNGGDAPLPENGIRPVKPAIVPR